MKVSSVVSALVAASCGSATLAFVPSTKSQRKPVTPLFAEKKQSSSIVRAASSFLLGLGLSAQVVFANDATMMDAPQHYSATLSSTMVQSSATLEQFSLPSYDAAKENALLDLNDEVQDVNKKTQASAKAKREYVDKSAEKTEMDELRRIEEEEAKLFSSMTKESDNARKERIAAEKAESRANRWNTF
jgi:hypothetical protein